MTRMKNDRYHAELLLSEVEKLLHFAARVDFTDPERNEEAVYAMNFCIVQIRERMGFLSDEFQRGKLGVTVNQFADFRNLLVHEYGKTDYSAYQDFIEKDVPRLRDALKKYLY